MKRNMKIFMLILVGILMIPSNKFDAKEFQSASACMTTNLTADKQTVEAGREIKFSLEYESIEPACSAEELASEEIILDFSPLVGEYGTVDTSFDTNVFNVDVDSSGVVTITFKDWDQIHNTVDTFSGSMIFTIMVSSEVVGNISIENDVTSDIGVIVTPPSTDTNNTSKWADETYASVGDKLNYNVRINTDKNEVTNFTGIDTPASGLRYVPDSAYVTNLETGETVDPSNYRVTKEGSNLVFTSTVPFNQAYVLHYQMLVIASNSSYINSFKAIYDNLVEEGGWTTSFDIRGGGEVSFINGQIDVLKTDQNGTPLEGAEFDVLDTAGDVVDHIVTGSDGHAVTTQLALGTYQVVETVSPEGYVLDPTPHTATIVEDQTTNNVVSVTVENEAVQTPDITLPEASQVGTIEITKVDDQGNYLAGAEFDITDSNGEVVSHVTSDESGIARAVDLPLGDYVVTETVAPQGYELDTTEYPISITAEAKVARLEIVNKLIDNSHGGGQDIEDSEVESEVVESEIVSEVTESEVTSEDEVELVEPKEEASEESEQTLAETGSNIIMSVTTAVVVLIGLFYIKFKKVV